MPSRAWVDAARQALVPLSDAASAAEMERYMKGVAPYLGIRTPVLRKALKAAWRPLAPLSQGELARLVQALWRLPEREYQYAAVDAMSWHRGPITSDFLESPVRTLVTTKPWWDTVDSLGSAVITPLVNRNPGLTATMWEWLRSGDIWLARAAIQHQRGNKQETDLALLFAMCEEHITDREFWIAKAIGWALRDASAIWPADVQAFIDRHPGIAPVARREAQRGVDRAVARRAEGL